MHVIVALQMHGDQFVSSADDNGHAVQGARLRKWTVLGLVVTCFPGKAQDPGAVLVDEFGVRGVVGRQVVFDCSSRLQDARGSVAVA